jgi:signal transduction histidine kinase
VLFRSLRHLDLSPDRYPEILESIRTARPLVIPEVVAEPLLAPVREGLKPLDLRSMIVMPLIVREKTIGAISLGYVGQARTFTDEQIGVLRSFATQAAIAIEKARLFAAAEQRATELDTLLEIDQAITARLEMSAVLEAMVAGAMRLLGNPFAQLILWDEATQRLRFGAALGPEAERVRSQTFEMGRGINGTVALSRQPMILDDYRASPYAIPECADIVATITVPILFGDRLLGVLHSHTTQPDRRFTTDDLRRFQMLASQAAIAIENARLYEAIRQHAAELEARVQERTHELEAANQQLQDASRHKSEFLANMSHELRTPLNSIIGFSELLLGQGVGPLIERQARFMGHIHQGGKHLLQLINDILDLSKVEAGKFVLQPEALPVAATLEDILVIARGLANKKAQEIQADIAPDLPPLNADPVRFKQILFNLLSNAVKFTPDGGRITVTAKAVPAIADCRLQIADLKDRGAALQSEIANLKSEIRDFLEIAVRDTGVGIKPEDMPRLFQEFVQLETTQAQRHEGTGLGLALTKRLVELHGGRIWAHSDGEGRGSTFTVLLPFAGPSDRGTEG